MSSFFAHAMAGMTIWGFARRTAPFEPFQRRAWYATAAVVSFLPDLDSYIGLSHRGVTKVSTQIAVELSLVATDQFGKRLTVLRFAVREE